MKINIKLINNFYTEILNDLPPDKAIVEYNGRSAIDSAF